MTPILFQPHFRSGREVPLGSYGLLQRASLMEEAVWQKIVHGLTTRGYSQVVRELKENHGRGEVDRQRAFH